MTKIAILYLILSLLIYAVSYAGYSLEGHWSKHPTVIFISGIIVCYSYLIFEAVRSKNKKDTG